MKITYLLAMFTLINIFCGPEDVSQEPVCTGVKTVVPGVEMFHDAGDYCRQYNFYDDYYPPRLYNLRVLDVSVLWTGREIFRKKLPGYMTVNALKTELARLQDVEQSWIKLILDEEVLGNNKPLNGLWFNYAPGRTLVLNAVISDPAQPKE